MRFKGCRALVTGGLGFIGSNLARQLSREGAAVTIVDACLTGCGANHHNLDGAPDIRLIHSDIGEPELFREAIEECDLIFNLAGDVSHLDSMRVPERDLERNTTAQLRFLESCRRWSPGVRIVYASTRQVYGVPKYLPVDEQHPIDPVDYNGVHKFAAGQYHLMLTRKGDLDAAIVRLTNVYGPRMSITAPNQGFLGAFLRKLMKGEQLTVFGEGTQLRDPLFVDDAVEAFLVVALCTTLEHRTFNAGGAQPLTLREVATIGSDLAGTPRPRLVPFPGELKAIDIGSYYTESRRLRDATGWEPRVDFVEGFARTLDFYRERFDQYMEAPSLIAVS